MKYAFSGLLTIIWFSFVNVYVVQGENSIKENVTPHDKYKRLMELVNSGEFYYLELKKTDSETMRIIVENLGVESKPKLYRDILSVLSNRYDYDSVQMLKIWKRKFIALIDSSSSINEKTYLKKELDGFKGPMENHEAIVHINSKISEDMAWEEEVSILSEFLIDNNERLRGMAYEKLMRRRDSYAVEAMGKVLEEDNWIHRVEAVKYLCQVGSAQSMKYVIKAKSDNFCRDDGFCPVRELAKSCVK